jgi:CPA1 family monovalent cation:H+ antiporter
MHIPAILPLLLTGMLIGPVTGILNPDQIFGDLLVPLVSLAVAVILFEGSLTLKFTELKGLETVVRRLITVGSLISATTSTLAAHYLVGFAWPIAILFGALMVVTGPTVIIPMIRTVRPKASIAQVLRWEGIVIDPLGALFTVLVFDFVLTQHLNVGSMLLEFSTIVSAGAISGLLAGWLLGQALRHHWVPEFLHNVFVLNTVLATFVISNSLADEAGLLAVTVMGIVLANMRNVPVRDILDFKETLSILLISALFILLAARIDLASFAILGWGALGVFAILQFIGRPLKVALATYGSNLNWRERALIAWIGPRGIVAAAIAAVFALKLEEAGVEQASLLVPLSFSIIIGTVVFQSVTAGWLARKLGVAEPAPNGLLIIGANPLAREIAKAMQQFDLNILLADDSWDNIRKARMEGLSTYYGNPVSEHADRNLDLIGLGKMLGLSPDERRNSLAAIRYRTEFDAESVYVLQSTLEASESEKRRITEHYRARTLFGQEISFSKLSSLLSKGGEIRVTRLTENFNFNTLINELDKKFIPMFAIDPKKRLRVFCSESKIEPTKDWHIVGLSYTTEPTQQTNS